MQEPHHNPYDDQQSYDTPSYTPYESTEARAEEPSRVDPAPTSYETGLPPIPPPDYANPYTYYPAASEYPPPPPGYQSPAAGYPPPTISSVPAHPEKNRTRQALWIALASVLVVAIVSAVSVFGITYLNRPTPTKTLDTFCKALQNEDYQTAFDQFSRTFQQNLASVSITEADFAAALGQDKIVSCTHGVAGESGTSTMTTLKLVHNSQVINNDTVTLTKDSSNNWKITDLQGASSS